MIFVDCPETYRSFRIIGRLFHKSTSFSHVGRPRWWRNERTYYASQVLINSSFSRRALTLIWNSSGRDVIDLFRKRIVLVHTNARGHVRASWCTHMHMDIHTNDQMMSSSFYNVCDPRMDLPNDKTIIVIIENSISTEFEFYRTALPCYAFRARTWWHEYRLINIERDTNKRMIDCDGKSSIAR
jgi:hypothetical protein